MGVILLESHTSVLSVNYKYIHATAHTINIVYFFCMSHNVFPDLNNFDIPVYYYYSLYGWVKALLKVHIQNIQ